TGSSWPGWRAPATTTSSQAWGTARSTGMRTMCSTRSSATSCCNTAWDERFAPLAGFENRGRCYNPAAHFSAFRPSGFKQGVHHVSSLASHAVLISIVCGALAVVYGLILTRWVLSQPAGTDRMREISAAVQEGAAAYLKRQYTTIAGVALVVFILIGVAGTWT